MKAVKNGKFILPNERGNFFVSIENILTAAEEIIDAQGNFVSPL